MSKRVRILVVDDDPIVRESFRMFFEHQEELEVVGEAKDGAEGVALYEELRPDVVLMDIQMPVMTGIDATRAICSADPQACVIALTTFGTNDYVVSALRAGASGYLLKDVGGPGLLAGIRQALAGDMPLSGRVRKELVELVAQEQAPARTVGPQVDLTPRETELLTWLAQGLTNQQIGERMYVSEGSVKQYLLQVGRKLGVRSRTGIVIRAIQQGVVDPYSLPMGED